MSTAHFPTITPEHWRASILRSRAEANLVVAQIRDRVRRKFSSQGSSVVEQVVHTHHVAGSIPALASISQPGTGRACVRLELERANSSGALTPAVQASSTVGTPLDGNLLSESGAPADKTARTETEPRAEENFPRAKGGPSHAVTAQNVSAPGSHGAETAVPTFTAAGSAALDRSEAKRRAEAGGGESISSIPLSASSSWREAPGRLLCGAQRSDCLADVILNGTDGRPGNLLSQLAPSIAAARALFGLNRSADTSRTTLTHHVTHG